ncbi:unnamed protein product [Ceutorhynchus assimilis]|uniref:Methionine synthase reductase n=1 Tax=Ceutorhynchus assimilis TaxID=467358 RepID=A0A9N9MWN5_9CUCU|nr:unnamed protein product [Ceutorhynchus assimilis]
MANFLKIVFEETSNQKNVDNYEYRNKPFSHSPVQQAFIKNYELLTQGPDVKTVYHVKLTLKERSFDFLPGDAIGILPENDENEVNELLIRLGVEEISHKPCKLEILENTTKKNATVPKYLPKHDNIYSIFLKYIDIRSAPKKLFLKSLMKYTKDPTEKEKLDFICSPAGSSEYTTLLTQNRSLLALLNSFPSCEPPIELILEHSTALNPRFFSIASSPLDKNLSIVFNILVLENGLKGVCTGWLEKCINSEQCKTIPIPIYFRKPSNFRLNNLDKKIVLVATGTGLAPFLGYLQHKVNIGASEETWLFYGCRYSTRDFLFGSKLEVYKENKTLTKLSTAFSREGNTKEYVQNRIFENKEDIVKVFDEEAIVYVCGDKIVVKDVKEIFVQCFMECKCIERPNAEKILDGLVESGRIVVDSWV